VGFDYSFNHYKFRFSVKGIRMETAEVITIAQQALWVALLLAGPPLGIGLLVGVGVGVLQAATSIQEMTLSFIPKLAAMLGALALFGAWQVQSWIRFFEHILEKIPVVLAL
jgi:flagellar biosynthetic protein FliQ